MTLDSRQNDKITFYLPGMFHCNGVCGQYPAISITGNHCALQCGHCGGRLLQSMIHATSPQALVDQCRHLAETGNKGVLISGGCDQEGRLPWGRFIPAIEQVVQTTPLTISVHSGLLDFETARRLKRAGVNQALIDIVGDDATYREICHMPGGIRRIESSLAALQTVGLEVVPHIVCGLHRGLMRGEHHAVEMIAKFDIRQVVIVSLMNPGGKVGQKWPSPSTETVARVIADIRRKMPKTTVSLGCARQRGNREMECLAIDAGVHRLALPSEEAVEHARKRGLTITFQKTCCSVSVQHPTGNWLE